VYVDIDELPSERPVWLLPTANRTAFSTALEQEAFAARTRTDLPEYEYTALQESDAALFPHGDIGQVSVDGTAYDMFALSTPAVERYIWYVSADSSTATPFEGLTPAERSFLRDLFDSEANGRENRAERFTGEAVVTTLSDQPVSYEGDRYTVRSKYIETPDSPSSGAYVGYQLDDSGASEGRTLQLSPPVPDAFLADAPIAVTPTQYRSALGCARARLDAWPRLLDPDETEAFLSGRDCRGVAHKLLADPPSLSLAFAGEPPDQGVWEPQSVRLIAAAKALSWERERQVERVYAEYPAHGVIRPVDVSVRRTAAYREALRTAEAIDGPPARVDNRAKCEPCEYRSECGVTTRSLRSLLGG